MEKFSYLASWMYVGIHIILLTIGNLVIFGLFISEGFSVQQPLQDLSKAVVVFYIAGMFNFGILYKMFVDAIRFGVDADISISKDRPVEDNGSGFDPEKVDVDNLRGLTRRE